LKSVDTNPLLLETSCNVPPCSYIPVSVTIEMSIQVESLPLPPSANPASFPEFGREVKGVHPGELTPEQFKEIEELLYKVSCCSCLTGDLVTFESHSTLVS
jgi:hypothetical protein